MPFGLCNAAATFQRLMQTVLQGLYPKQCLIYLDDVIAFGRTAEEHNDNLRTVLERLQEAGLTLNPKKCCFLRRSVAYLGHTISGEGIQVTQERTQAVEQWLPPKNQTELQSFLGLTNYYRKFMRGYAKIAAPLHNLTEKEFKKSFKWETEH